MAFNRVVDVLRSHGVKFTNLSERQQSKCSQVTSAMLDGRLVVITVKKHGSGRQFNFQMFPHKA